MGSWWRSRDMKYVSVIVSEDAAHSCVQSLGELGALQLTDLNPDQTPFQRRYVGFIKRCDELERKLRYMEKEMAEFGLMKVDAGKVTAGLERLRGAGLLDVLEAELEKYEEQLLELNNYSKELTLRYNEKIEYHECLEKGKGFFEDATRLSTTAEPSMRPTMVNPLLRGHDDGSQPLLDDESNAVGMSFQRAVEMDMKFASTIGVVATVEKARFERMLFRSTRGNCFVRFAEIERPIADAATGAPEKKLVFIVFFKSEVIGSIVNKICAAFGARCYPVPDCTEPGDAARLGQVVRETRAELADAREVLLKNRELRLALCSRLAEQVEAWKQTVFREKASYHALNLFRADVSGMLRAEGWIVAELESEARALVMRAHAAVDLAGASMLAPVPKPWPQAPTYFETNSFTYAYQEFVDTYGVPRYKEINPALFTAITFPFLFGMMYGDVGHGSCVFLAGLSLLATHNKSGDRVPVDEITCGLYASRYMLTMMGACAVYCGLVYNDCFSLALNIFGSTYKWHSNGRDKPEADQEAERQSNFPYLFGMDPAWHVSGNELLFYNSMKMKTAVVVGILQMTLGILLKGVNAVYFGDKIGLAFEFVPMIVFDMALFGYMVILIFTKWAINWDNRMLKGTCIGGLTYPFDSSAVKCEVSDKLKAKCVLGLGGESNGCSPPNLINQLINIALNPGTVEEPMYSGQAITQLTLIIVAFLCVPVLLLGRPSYIYLQRRAVVSDPEAHATNTQIEMQTDPEVATVHVAHHGGDDATEHGEDHSFAEALIHQCIETIEFVLGMVSNTASYLRLWALSLAHSELAQVFWEKTLRVAINTHDAVAIFLAYAIFAAVTAAVLLAMDLLECFLHALRLHWVEFQNKFYKADGFKFAPFKC